MNPTLQPAGLLFVALSCPPTIAVIHSRLPLWDSRFTSLAEVILRKLLAALFWVLILVAAPPLGFGWGREGHEVIALIAEQNMTPTALQRAKAILGGASLEEVANWADEFRHDHRETGPWHYIDIPLADSKIDLARQCPDGNCVIGKTQQFLAVLRDPNADRAAKAEALEFVIHFVGDMHQPLHDEDNGDKGGNDRHVILDSHPDSLHWVWDTGLVERIDRNPQALAAELERRITDQDRANWTKGGIDDWVMEGHALAQTVAYGDLGTENPAVISPEYERQADLVIETQLEKAGVRLAYVLNSALQ